MQSWLSRMLFLWRLAKAGESSSMKRVVDRLATALKNPLSSGPTLKSLSANEQQLVREIREQTVIANRNNLTRTEAYLNIFNACPDLHWALLAHLVSRNGGWGMTDLQGEWFTRMALTVEREALFRFLERANWLIFGDAYPQLLLRRASLQEGRCLSHLLPLFGVSRWMHVMWEDYWTTGNAHQLTVALIMNEQNYIEHRLVRNEYYHSPIFSIEVQLQNLLHLNWIVFPMDSSDLTALIGANAPQFASLSARISTGMRLYHALFETPTATERIVRWARAVKHTGSRADYWPDVFTRESSDDTSRMYRRRVIRNDSNQWVIDASAPLIVSPAMPIAWPDVQHEPAGDGDWFQDVTQSSTLFSPLPAVEQDFPLKYLESVHTTESLVIAKESLIGPDHVSS